jgi:hypothetical protein
VEPKNRPCPIVGRTYREKKMKLRGKGKKRRKNHKKRRKRKKKADLLHIWVEALSDK